MNAELTYVEFATILEALIEQDAFEGLERADDIIEKLSSEEMKDYKIFIGRWK